MNATRALLVVAAPALLVVLLLPHRADAFKTQYPAFEYYADSTMSVVVGHASASCESAIVELTDGRKTPYYSEHWSSCLQGHPPSGDPACDDGSSMFDCTVLQDCPPQPFCTNPTNDPSKPPSPYWCDHPTNPCG